ncbi:MAG TPA: putative glycoside hydrolase [Verrucomicrobiae bacterium]|nr:putative glycoside hydrolase [Verrucomicrobiae bacterium]
MYPILLVVAMIGLGNYGIYAPVGVDHVSVPNEVRGIYWTAETARTKRADELTAYMLKTGLNTAVIDIKMDNGEVDFPPTSTLETLAADGIYRIARIPVMRDSTYGLAHPEDTIHSTSGKPWRDKTGAIWLNPSRPGVADYNLELAREAYAAGFDEIQFDYVRFASDGALSAIAKTDAEKTMTKEEIMKAFFNRVGDALKQESIPVSFDLFGVTFLSNNEVGIGQHMEDVYPNADYVSPMAYPSHYWPGYLGYANPAVHPYEVVKDTLDKGAAQLLMNHDLSPTSTRPHFRPWIQDFDIGAVYTAPMIEAEIKAARDAGASGFLIWNARNVYEPANYK